MPVAIPIIATVAGAAATSALGTAIGATLLGSTFLATGAASLGGFIVSSAINQVGGSLSKKSKTPSLSVDAVDGQTTSRSSIETHKIIYGQALVSGPVVFDGATSSGVDNLGNTVTGDDKFRHFVIALAGHEVAEIGTIYIENKPVTLDDDGFVIEAPYSKDQSSEFAVSATIQSVASIPGGLEFTTDGANAFEVGETVYINFGGTYFGAVISSVPSSTTFRIPSAPSTATLQTSSPAYVKRTSSTGVRYIRIKKFLGTADQEASPDLLNEITDWTENHRLRGIAHLVVRIQQTPDFSMNIQSIAALVKGKKVYDPRTQTTGWADNSALCVRDYFASDYDFDCDDDEINDDYAIAAANICDEMVTVTSVLHAIQTVDTDSDTLTLNIFPLPWRIGQQVQVANVGGSLPGGIAALTNYYLVPVTQTTADSSGVRVKLATSLANARAGAFIDLTSAGSGTNYVLNTAAPRYTANGVLDAAAGMFDNLQALLTSMAGNVTYVQGKFRINPAAYQTPEVTIDEDMLAGSVTSQARPSRKDLFNAVRGTLIDPTQNFVVTDFPIITNATYETQDGGDRIEKDIELPFTNDTTTAQRIAKLLLETSRQGITVTMPLNHAILGRAVNDTVYVDNARRGWSGKVFRIVRFNLGVPGPFTVTLKEEAAAAYEWNSGEATVTDPAPDTTLPDPWIVSPPGVPSIGEDLYETRDGTSVKAKAILSWAPSPDAYVRWYVPHYRRIEALDWIILPKTNLLTAEVNDIAPGTYEFAVEAINHIGAASNFNDAKASPIPIYGLNNTPGDITGLSIQATWGQVRIGWNTPTDLDVKIGGRILIRHSEAPTGATWEDSTTIGHDTIPGNANGWTLPGKAGTYLVKAEDSSGIASANAATITTKGVSLIAFSEIVTISEDPGFTGTHSNTIEDSGILKLGGGILFDDIPSVDGMPDFDFSAGVATGGTYTALTYTDLGSVLDVRLQSVIELSTVNIYDLMDSRAAFIDDWQSFDGNAAGGVVDCFLEVKTTDDDPAGTPTWTDWHRIDVADDQCRAIWPRAQLLSYDPAYNVYVETLALTVKAVA